MRGCLPGSVDEQGLSHECGSSFFVQGSSLFSSACVGCPGVIAVHDRVGSRFY